MFSRAIERNIKSFFQLHHHPYSYHEAHKMALVYSTRAIVMIKYFFVHFIWRMVDRVSS
ncbi:hypothetical protein TGS27_0490 [Geobacillus stearothermophilus]|uniref:Uncharacterized protein n=1 Tax=Geobacillus stearothermophilus TaxID=1422 RepID=A0A150MSM6_GEOSE|nr:hypothetical protein B4109_3126 [Geobacillus stearothermophilus]OAO86498.1 hypothetical protein TGS27_0490 [Geobacillus stearothermophilus]